MEAQVHAAAIPETAEEKRRGTAEMAEAEVAEAEMEAAETAEVARVAAAVAGARWWPSLCPQMCLCE